MYHVPPVNTDLETCRMPSIPVKSSGSPELSKYVALCGTSQRGILIPRRSESGNSLSSFTIPSITFYPAQSILFFSNSSNVQKLFARANHHLDDSDISISSCPETCSSNPINQNTETHSRHGPLPIDMCMMQSDRNREFFIGRREFKKYRACQIQQLRLSSLQRVRRGIYELTYASRRMCG